MVMEENRPSMCRDRPWWDGRTRLEKSLLFVTVTSLLLVAMLAVTLAVIGDQESSSGKKEAIFLIKERKLVSINSTRDVCTTQGCILAAAEIINSLDESVDPCEDFYQFACGGWLQKHNIKEDRSHVSIWTDVDDYLKLKLKVLLEKPLSNKDPEFVAMLKKMYYTCTDTKTIENLREAPLKDMLRKIGGWPVVLGSKWNPRNFDWIDMLIEFRRLGYDHNMLMSLYVYEDYRNNSNNIFNLDQPYLGMPDRIYYLRGFNDTVTVSYFRSMVAAAMKLGVDEITAEEELIKAFQFETKLANFSLPREERRNWSQKYNKYRVAELQRMAPQVDWLKYFRGMSSDVITYNEPVVVVVPGYVRNFAELISNADKRTVANYMVWRMVSMSLPLLSKEWRSITHNYTQALTGKEQEGPRWELCLSFLSSTLEVALGSFYIRNHFKEESKEAAMEIVEYIHKEFLDTLESIDWMDYRTRAQAIEKARTITPHIGYPKELLNDTAISEFYVNLTLYNKSYFGNAMKVRKFGVDFYFNELRKPNIKGEWKKHAGAAAVNAYYYFFENSMEFPAGVLQSPFFAKDRPHYINFGAIGIVIGHEITHGFDDEGRQFDKDGMNNNWWETETDEHFKQKAQCIIDQYSNYRIKELDINLNGINTQGENIADLGGLKEAYKAYRTWVKEHWREEQLPGLKYTPEQLFWISSAHVECGKFKPASMKLRIVVDPHTPFQYRVVGTVSNLAEFAKDFKCPSGSPMNPRRKCHVW